MIDWTEIAPAFVERHELDLAEFIKRQRWFGGKSRNVVGLGLVEYVSLRAEDRLGIAIVEVRFDSGTSELYQLVVGNAEDTTDDDEFITTVGDVRLAELSASRHAARQLISNRPGNTAFRGSEGTIHFSAIRTFPAADMDVHRLIADQSNTSNVINEQLLFKIYRRLPTGTSPELEMLLFLTEHDFAQIPALVGWYDYEGSDLRTTLGIMQQYLPDAIDGWSLGLDELRTTPDRFIPRMDRLGKVIGDMHCVLASDAADADFSPEDPTDETAGILAARIEGQIDVISDALPSGHAEELRVQARQTSQHRVIGRLIRTHGDLHLGQVLWNDDDWLVIDFEGEPTRTLGERRQKFHPLRDAAGMLRSISYLAAVCRLERRDSVSDAVELEARNRFFESYRTHVNPAGLIPDDRAEQERLLRTFELEKLLYELSYEIDNRPDWQEVPLVGIDRLLDSLAN